MHDWLEAAAARIAAATGDDPAAYALDEEAERILLDLARIAAHESGDRRNAPLAAYLTGLARGRNPGAGLDDLAGAAGAGATDAKEHDL